MINKLQINFLIFFLVCIVGTGFASAADVNFSADTTVTVNSMNLTILAGSVATEPLVVGATTLTAVVPAGTFILVSANKYTLSNNQNLPQTCGSSINSVTVTGPLTVVFTPNSSLCTATQTNNGGFIGMIKSLTTSNPTMNSSVSTPYNFGNTTLKNGSKGDGVKELQRFLNDTMKLGLIVDGKLGPKTIIVIKKWQKDNGLVMDGLIGTKTKAKMNALVKK